ncbi:DUF1835 domain-containing protein [Marinicella rhabdoformis]|uniref:DUF1835 domain-containing protein n=1 Tax=Marinicella rhabdoformis TaxID=2580566 RepID=UPI0012AEC68D|nr:DUF1835 domain-containing protein [Marinicella rhabdoformis]
MSELTLNITNGDCAVDALSQAGVIGDILPWRDVLHIGPLLPGDLMGRFEQSRVLFLSQYFKLPASVVSEKFKSRHTLLNDLNQYQTIRLWFEHDLYDQLQLIQIVAFLAECCDPEQLRWVVTDHFIGPAQPSELHELFRFDRPVSKKCIKMAPKLWQALTDDNPMSWSALDHVELSAWPFISQTLARLMAEFPDVNTGLSLTQWLLISALSTSPMSGATLFKAYNKLEWAQFMGDSVFEKELAALTTAKCPLLFIKKDHGCWIKNVFELTPLARDVMVGKKNHVKLNGIDRWIGGAHLKENSCWWFNNEVNQLEQ